MTDATVQLLICSARPGVSKAQVLEATRITNAVLRRLPGYVEHEIAYTAANGRWIDVVRWSDRCTAQAAKAAYALQPESQAISAIIEQRWIDSRHVELTGAGLGTVLAG